MFLSSTNYLYYTRVLQFKNASNMPDKYLVEEAYLLQKAHNKHRGSQLTGQYDHLL